MSILKEAVEAAGVQLKKYCPEKSRPVYTDRTSLSIPKFIEDLQRRLGKQLRNFPDIIDCLHDSNRMVELLEEWSDAHGPQNNAGEGTIPNVPNELGHLTLNIDMSTSLMGKGRFFCTTREELRDHFTHGDYFISRTGLSMSDAAMMARPVVPKYMPRHKPGIHPTVDPTLKMTVNYFNSYIPASWDLWRMRNPKEWEALSANPPKEILEMLKHVIPVRKEREYFYAWLYTSITSRVYVYLVLQGFPGVGKNRIKLLLTALHGKNNSSDGKKETFGANGSKFNSQLFESTMGWWDELRYDQEMEARMKEYQNDSASKELKGVDATRNSEIHCSMAISNNLERDNYIPFNSRKFAPLVVGNKALNTVMDPELISQFSDKLEEGKSTFDVKYVAQIAKWILRVGPKYVPDFPFLEYRGPQFWVLAHASMSRWQKIAIGALTTKTNRGMFPGWNEERKAFKWSQVEEALRRKKEFESKDYRDPSTVKGFFDNYRDLKGEKVFETQALSSVIHDFYIKPIYVKEIDGPLVVDIGDGDRVDLTADKKSRGRPTKPENLLRPPGMSQYQWNKMQAEHAALNGKGKKKNVAKEKSDAADL